MRRKKKRKGDKGKTVIIESKIKYDVMYQKRIR